MPKSFLKIKIKMDYFWTKKIKSGDEIQKYFFALSVPSCLAVPNGQIFSFFAVNRIKFKKNQSCKIKIMQFGFSDLDSDVKYQNIVKPTKFLPNIKINHQNI